MESFHDNMMLYLLSKPYLASIAQQASCALPEDRFSCGQAHYEPRREKMVPDQVDPTQTGLYSHGMKIRI